MSKVYRRNLFCSSAVGVCVALAATAAAAQAPAAEPAGDVEAIVVTGSRLTSGFNQPTPVTVLGTDELQRRNPANVLEAINSLPSARPTISTTGNVRNTTTQAGIQGSVDLRGLGSARTLVLVDGQRWVSGGFTGVPDTNMFPVSLIDRIDIVTGGASAAYGSDAVAGVANFVLNDRLEGVRGSVSAGRSKYKDLGQVTASLGAGVSFADGRGHLVGAFDYGNNEGGHGVYSRPWGAEEPLQLGTGAVGSANRPAGTPAQIFGLGVERNDGAPGGLVTSGPLRGTTWDANGNPYQFVFGRAYGTSMVGSGANYGFNPQGFTVVGNPFTRKTGYAKLSYDVSDDTKVWVSGAVGRVRDQSFGGPPYQIGPYNISIDNPYLPAQTRAAMVANNLTTISVTKFITGLGKTGGISQTQHVFKTYRAAAGASGRFGGGWDWDFYLTQGESKSPYTVPYGLLVGNAAAANYVVRNPTTGAIECGPIATNPNLTATTRAQVTSGCVPYNIFGSAPATEASVDYFVDPIDAEIVSKQRAAGVNLRGQPFEAWGGPVSFAIGAEARWEELGQTAEPQALAGHFSQSNQSAYFGKNDVQEAYVEVGVPMFRDLGPFAQALDFNGAARITNYKLGGTVETWKLGATYEANDAWRLRLTSSRDIRAPNLYDLFGVLSPQPMLGINSPFTGVNGTVFSGLAGNRNLVPEKADTFTGGIVFQPSGALSGFRASVDYFNINIKDVISIVGVQDILNGCRAGNQIYCGSITFDAANPLGVSRVDRIGDNLLELQSEGWDFEASYRVPSLGSVPGAFNIRFLGTYTEHMKVAGSTGVVDYVGTGISAPAGGGVPKFRGTLDLQYTLNRFRTTVQLSGFTKLKISPLLVGPDDPAYSPNASNSIEKNQFPGAIYVNWSGAYGLNVLGNPELFWSVSNVLNQAPPRFALVAFAFGAANYYDMVGRYAQAGIRFSF